MGRQVEIGSLRERVEVIEEPVAGPHGRIGRIRHANGENVAVDAATLDRLTARARAGRGDAGERMPFAPDVIDGALWA